eukprot:457233-Prymnesium_polylepis.1
MISRPCPHACLCLEHARTPESTRRPHCRPKLNAPPPPSPPPLTASSRTAAALALSLIHISEPTRRS